MIRGVLEGGLEGEGDPHLPPVAVGVEGGGGPRAAQLLEGAEEQGELVLAVHGVGVVGGHLGVTSLQPSLRIYIDICVGFKSVGHRNISLCPL